MLRSSVQPMLLVVFLLLYSCNESGGTMALAPQENEVLPELPGADIGCTDSTRVFRAVPMPVIPAPTPIINVSPEVIDFEQVFVGEVREAKVHITNPGSADLHLSGFRFTGSQSFMLNVQGAEYVAGQATVEGVTFPGPIVLRPEEGVFFTVFFSPLDEQAAEGTLVVRSDDPANPEVMVLLQGNQLGSCVATLPQQVKFGGKKIDTIAALPLVIQSCGEVPLEVTGIQLADDSHPDFSVDLSALEHVPSLDEPLVLPVGSEVTIDVVFAPSAEAPVDSRGNPIPPEGILLIDNNSLYATKEVYIGGFGALITCPTSVIQVAEGSEVFPQQVLHLFGDQSWADTGAISAWEWSVEQPLGSQSVFIPSPTFPNPTFEANVSGKYTFHLKVWDEQGVPSCAEDSYEVFTCSCSGLHVELLWHTPGDPDETDEGPAAGTDLDLHFVHPWATGPDIDEDGVPDGWFDQPFDCFWFNAHPEWGSFDPSYDDNPGLDRDDTDGAGPEYLNLQFFEDVTYRIGVHYWDDHGFGPSFATIRVYYSSSLLFEIDDVELVEGDFWEVATLEFPTGKVKLVTNDEGGLNVTPNYENPYFQN